MEPQELEVFMRFIRWTKPELRTSLSLLAVAFATSACGSASLEDPEHVAVWANAASAVGVYVHAYEPIGFADGEVTFADAACPATSDNGETATIEGGCTDQTGSQWVGKATIVRSGEDRTLRFDGYGKQNGGAAASTARGTVAVSLTSSGEHRFDVDLVLEGGITTTIDYVGTVRGGYDGATTWNGSGTVKRKGVAKPVGTVEATTVDEVLDNSVCSGQAVSGKTTLLLGDDVAVITYDGAKDCDPDEAAGWSLNGEDQGLITGIVCSVGAPGAGARGGVFGALLLVVLGAIGVARRACPHS
jgi:hypothetical protein